MESVQIVEAVTKDIQTIREIALAAWPVAYSPILSVGQVEYMLNDLYSPEELQQQMNSNVQFLLALSSDKPIGFAGFGPYENDYKLYKLYVHPDVQKIGAGKALLEEAEKYSKTAGAKRLILNVHRNNPARNFYEKNGFTIYETIDIPFGPGFVLNDYLMEKIFANFSEETI
jgi:diamine N-acetyltransferase